jgi:drug/metabolite transporter (DMT)-like permease
VTPRQFGVLLLLAAVWGGSFLFMRIAAPVLGPVWLIELRSLLAGLALLPVVLLRSQLSQLWLFRRELAVVGLLNAALPFVLFAYAASQLTAGATSILNATVPLFSALFAFAVLHERLGGVQIAGIALGFVGVVLLVVAPQQEASVLPPGAVAAGLGAAVCYVLAAHYTKHHLAGVGSMAYVTGSQLSAAALLLPFLPFFLPTLRPGAEAVWSVIGLALLSTSLAFWLYFRLLHQVGATRTLTVTYLIPVFAIFWGWLWLHERVDWPIVASCALIMVGIALATRRPRKTAR